MLGLRGESRRLYLRALSGHLARCAPVPDSRRAIVFTPHQDDETLGCGGTIAAKRRAGTVVKLVCFGDGGTLREVRNAEMREAARILGIDPADVTFLNLPEGHFEDAQRAAVDAVVAIINREQPEDVFVTYRNEPHPDHVLAYAIVSEAVARSTCSPSFYEYPVWFWNHWPLVAGGSDEAVTALTSPRHGVAAAMRLLREFRYAADVSATIDVKRAALAQYRSQLQQRGAPGAMTLRDYGNSEWLQLLMQSREMFRRSVKAVVR